MRQTMVLVWKEWREQRWFLYAGLAAFLAFPLMDILYDLRKGNNLRTDMPEGIVLGLGGLLAIFVGVGAVCRDLSPRLQSFWQSRPVRLGQWLAGSHIPYPRSLVVRSRDDPLAIWTKLRRLHLLAVL